MKEKKIIYLEKQKNSCIRFEINFDTPRTQEAARILGLKFDDCIKKPIRQFSILGVDERVIKLRYVNHLNQIEKNIKEINIIRKDIVKAQRKESRNKKKNKDQPSNVIETILRPNYLEDFFFSEGEFDSKAKLTQAEKAEIIKYTKKAYKEINRILDDQKKDAYIKQKKVLPRQNYGSNSAIRCISSIRTPNIYSRENYVCNSRFCKKDRSNTVMENSALPVASTKTNYLKRFNARMSVQEKKTKLMNLEWQKNISRLNILTDRSN